MVRSSKELASKGTKGRKRRAEHRTWHAKSAWAKVCLTKKKVCSRTKGLWGEKPHGGGGEKKKKMGKE